MQTIFIQPVSSMSSIKRGNATTQENLVNHLILLKYFFCPNQFFAVIKGGFAPFASGKATKILARQARRQVLRLSTCGDR